MAAYTLYLVTSNVGSALVAEGARSPQRAIELTRQAAWNTARLVVPLAVVGIVVAPYVLEILGPGYAAEATTALRLLLLSAIPQVIVGISIGAARVRQDLRMIMVVYAGLALGGVGGSWLLVGRLGLTGVGLACLGSQLVVACALVLAGRTGLGIELGPHRVLTGIERVPRRLRRRRSSREARRRIAPALAAVGLDADSAFTLLTSDSDTLVAALAGQREPMVIKIATSPAACVGLLRHATVVTELGASLPVGPPRSLLPRVLYDATTGGDRVLIETRLAGVTADACAPDPRVGAAALDAVGALHRATATTATIEGELMTAWVRRPLERLGRVRSLSAGRGLADLAGILHAELEGREVLASAVHGDFWPGNVLVDRRPDRPVITGIVDWENASSLGLPDSDLLHWWLAVQPVQMGAAVHRGLSRPDELRSRLAEDGIVLPNPALSIESVVLLTWLGHVTGGLDRTAADHLGQVWLARNVRPILALVGSGWRPR